MNWFILDRNADKWMQNRDKNNNNWWKCSTIESALLAPSGWRRAEAVDIWYVSVKHNSALLVVKNSRMIHVGKSVSDRTKNKYGSW